jgi:hypothetical protein
VAGEPLLKLKITQRKKYQLPKRKYNFCKLDMISIVWNPIRQDLEMEHGVITEINILLDFSIIC